LIVALIFVAGVIATSMSHTPATPATTTAKVTPIKGAPILPPTDAVGTEWVRAHLPVYENAYRRCGEIFDLHSPAWSVDAPKRIWGLENDLTDAATKAGGKQAGYVAFEGCQDGISDYPWSGIPELKSLQRYP
jgi:hypothetical protein